MEGRDLTAGLIKKEREVLCAEEVKEKNCLCLFQDRDCDLGGGERGVDPHPAVGQ